MIRRRRAAGTLRVLLVAAVVGTTAARAESVRAATPGSIMERGTTAMHPMPHRGSSPALPMAVLLDMEAAAVASPLGDAAARALADSLLAVVSSVRELRPLRPVAVRTAGRDGVRARLAEISQTEGHEAILTRDRARLVHLGLLPRETDVTALYRDLLQEHLAGFYDIDRRELLVADWIPVAQQAPVLAHELAHALQDQHFSLRVRRRLGFDTADAEAAWQCLVEGDAAAVMAEMALRGQGRTFGDVADSAGTLWASAPPEVRAAAGELNSEPLRAAPPIVREALRFPYAAGLRYVAALHRQGGWKAVDAAYVHPPASTEQILHPSRFDNHKDAPVRVAIPDLRGLLGTSYAPVSSGVLGEQDLLQYLGVYIDPEVARVAAYGWGGATGVLYAGGPEDPAVFALVSVWDSEDDAVEFFGGLIGALEARYPGQQGDSEASSQDQVIWKLDDDGKHLNLLRLRGREVTCLESIPGPRLQRILAKLDTGIQVEDPSPEMRSRAKEELPWNRRAVPVAGDALVPRVEVPEGWAQVLPEDSLTIFEARRGDARMRIDVDRTASRELGLDGYAHDLAAHLQKRGRDVYVLTDVDYPREGLRLYQHIFMQSEAGREHVYHIGVVDLGQGLGAVIVHGPTDDAGVETAALERVFYQLLGSLVLVPGGAAPPGGGPSAPAGAPAPDSSSSPPKG